MYSKRSLAGDAPEEILLSTVDLSADDWNEWQAIEAVAMLSPELQWEGSELPISAILKRL